MTIREKMKERLVEHGLWPDEANMVLDDAEKSEVLEPMFGRWKDSVDGYPPQMFAAVWISIKSVAVEWIDANKPKHFARTMFV